MLMPFAADVAIQQVCKSKNNLATDTNEQSWKAEHSNSLQNEALTWITHFLSKCH